MRLLVAAIVASVLSVEVAAAASTVEIPPPTLPPEPLLEFPTWVDIASHPTGRGYWLVNSAGRVESFGSAAHHGDAENLGLRGPVVAMAATASGNGYWLAAADGGVFAFGDAGFHGSVAKIDLVGEIVAMDTTRSGAGYWLLGEDGGVFALGDAVFAGRASTELNSAGEATLVSDIVSSHDGRGYFVLSSNPGSTGPIGFGDTCCTPGMATSDGHPEISMALTPSGNGYWSLLNIGFVRAVGDAQSLGGRHALTLNATVVALEATPTGEGYWIAAADGGVFAYGDAVFAGSAVGK